MAEEKKKIKLPHWLPLVLSLSGVAVLMVLYVIFMGWWLGGSMMTEQEQFAQFTEYVKTAAEDITALSELDGSVFAAAGDDKPYALAPRGNEQELRDRVFIGGAYAAESYMSAASGKRCVRYVYSWHDLECTVIYDKGNAALHTDGTGFSAIIDDDIAAAVVGSEIL